MSIFVPPPFMGGPPPAEITFLTVAGLPDNTSSYNYGTRSLGAAAPDRFIIASVHLLDVSLPSGINTVTLGGQTMTPLSVIGGPATPTNHNGFFGLLFPTGTSANFSFTALSSANASIMALFRATGLLSFVPRQIATADDNTLATNINAPKDGFVVGSASNNENTSSVWTGLTKRGSLGVDDDELSVASDNFAAADANRAISVAFGLPVNPRLLNVIAMR